MFIDKNLLDKTKIISILFFPISLLLGPATLNIYAAIFIIFFLFFDGYKAILKYKYFFTSSIILFLYLIIISFLNYIEKDSFVKSLLFIRFPLLAIGVGYFFFKFKILNKFIKLLLIIFIFLFVDSMIQFYFQKNIFFQEPLTTGNVYRITSVFGKESILGSYILKIVYPSLVIYFLEYKKNYNHFLLFFILSLIIIILSGERIIFLKFILFNFILLIFLGRFKNLLIISFISAILIFIFLNFNYYFYERALKFYEAIINFTYSPYFPLFEKAFIMFKDNIYFGVGFKNFRHLCNAEEYTLSISYLLNAGCSTHPHNYIFEIVSETGIFGLVLFFNIFFYVIIYSKHNFKKINYISYLSIFIVLLWPIGTNSSFFSSFNGYIIWFNIGILLSYINKNEDLNSHK